MNFGFQISWNPRGSSQTWSQLDDSMTFWWFCPKNSRRNSNALSCSVLKLPCVLTTPFSEKLIVWRKRLALPITILGTVSWVTTASFSNFLGLKMGVYLSHNSWQSCWYLHRILFKNTDSTGTPCLDKSIDFAPNIPASSTFCTWSISTVLPSASCGSQQLIRTGGYANPGEWFCEWAIPSRLLRPRLLRALTCCNSDVFFWILQIRRAQKDHFKVHISIKNWYHRSQRKLTVRCGVYPLLL